jgi:ABC-2 type transport system ATP-binding protein
MISVEDLKVVYGRHVVLAGLDLKLEPGRVHGLIGRNGAGKSTLLDTLYGFVSPAAGRMLYRGMPLRRGHVGYLPASNHFYPMLTGREYLRLFRSRRPEFNIEGWNELFELPLDALIERYSLGMQKKLALLGVLSLGRPFLVLDEPYNGLDLETNHILGRLLRELAAGGGTVLVTSHVLGTLKDGCNAVHLLASGRILRTFRPHEYGQLEENLLDEETARKLERVQGLLTPQ